ncbi:MAG: hypothetical protein ACFFA0_14540 [Promethearchaeota archaeon]
MKELLKIYNVSDNAVKIYLEGTGKFPFTLSEIHKIIPKSSIDEVKEALNELISKKLVLIVKTKYSGSFTHYLFLPPFAALLNAISNLNDNYEDAATEVKEANTAIEAFQDNILQDIELISQNLIEVISTQSKDNQTTEILVEVEKNVKKFSQVLLTDVNELISKLKTHSIVNEIDIERVIRAVNKKIGESKDIISSMFTQFRDIIGEMGSPNIPTQVESFKTFIRKLGESIDKRSNEFFQDPSSIPMKNLQIIEKSLYNILMDYLSKEILSAEKFTPLYSIEKLKEIISYLLKTYKEKLIIVVPNIEDFIPLEEFDLEYPEIPDSESIAIKQSSTQKKSISPPKGRSSITKKQKKDLEEKIDFTAKRVSDLKGYELSHDVADILAMVSDINPESLIIENVQGWLNRLLVIRKYLDQNTQYLILEDIGKWKKDYLKIKKKEETEQPEKKIAESIEDNGKSIETSDSVKKAKISIISTEFHNNKHVIALKKKCIEYLRLKDNNTFAIISDNATLVFGISQKVKGDPKYEISGLITSYKPFMELIQPNIDKIINEAKPVRELQINNGFNEIIENINDYSGKKISKKLTEVLNVAFEKDGISLNILEFKLLIGKLEKYYYPLEDDMKAYVIEELNKLNKEFSSIELIYPPEFKPPAIDEKKTEEFKLDTSADIEITPIDPKKVNSLFDLFLEKVDDLKGVELGDQIEKFIEVILKLQGYSQIIDWKNNLSKLDKTLDQSLKDEIKLDFLNWKKSILNPNLIKEKDHIKETVNKLPQKDYLSESREEYISPGLSQSQFQSDSLDLSESKDESKEIEPSVKMKEIFDDIEKNFTELNGIDISKKILNIVDIILETEGYSMDLKEIKDWTSKLRSIRKPLEDDIKEDFVLAFFKWKEKYLKEDSDNQNLDFGPSVETTEEIHDEHINTESNNLSNKIDALIQTINTSTGSELSKGLQDISDIVLPSHGAVTANALRQWISKLRSIRDLLEDEIRQEFLEVLEKWKNQFT